MGKQRVIDILCRRDGCTAKEAAYMIERTLDEIHEDPDYADEIIMCNLGLEMDYIFDIID